MHQPETRKYQLFPRERQLPPVNAGKQLDPEQAFAAAMGQSGDKAEKSEKSAGLRLRIKEHNLIRRRKVSVPELGPMTTVQEVAMDSPTIPGRPALHERSISSPVNTWRQHNLAESMTSVLDASDENTELNISPNTRDPQKSSTAAPAQPMSPKSLTPLVIPSQNGALPRLARQLSLSRLRSGSNSSEPASRSARTDESPKQRTPFTPYTPQSAAAYITTPKSAVTSSALATPITAPSESRESPRPWEKVANTTSPQTNNVDPMSTPKAEAELAPRSGTAMTHRRNQSDTGSIMERGRPRKRLDGTSVGGGLTRKGSKRSKSAERRAFEALPQGWKPNEATKMMEQSEVAYLQKQALGQAMRFEVLKKDDVESLSKELRHLDERTDYLRRTYTSLRAGRRNLHSRICQYLRSPRVAKFSYDSMLKQEEALAELDASIDDWVTKLDQAENRRTRVRQKLLEHVAAAATIAGPSDIAGASEFLQQAMGVRAPSGLSDMTPPRSPIKAEMYLHAQSPSTSPQRVVARLPSVIPEVPAEEAATACLGLDDTVTERQSALQRMESIRIYADSDVYALLADVESEFTKLSGGVTNPEPAKTSVSDEKRKELHRARSHELLSSRGPKPADKAPRASPGAPSPPTKDSAANDGDVFLTAAVFRSPTVTVA
ncbi:Up-regulated during septation-domain-containing protein [Xylariales sp. AK1849]|nr:Up-regulated during septation-domain-containing protein [Xylariales sp. AK1849]